MTDPKRRPLIVAIALFTVLTLTSGLLMAIAPAPLAAPLATAPDAGRPTVSTTARTQLATNATFAGD